MARAKAKPKQKPVGETTAGTAKLNTPSSVTVLKPGDKDYDAEKDPNVVGYVPGSSSWQNDTKTPYDFMADPATGKRPNETKAPWGCSSTDMTEGLKTFHTLPSIRIWKEGAYLSDAYWEPEFKESELPTALQNKLSGLAWPKSGKMVPEEIWNYYIVSGEGTPGNNYYRLYLLPREICKEAQPKHPLMWPEHLKAKPTYGYGTPSYPAGSYSSQVSSAVSKPKTQKLPAGVRMRCTGCGHWFRMDDLSGHSQVCPASSEGDADWAMMCDDLCGCRTLDDASKCKPGFPRKKEEPEATDGEEAKDKPEVTSSQPTI